MRYLVPLLLFSTSARAWVTVFEGTDSGGSLPLWVVGILVILIALSLKK